MSARKIRYYHRLLAGPPLVFLLLSVGNLLILITPLGRDLIIIEAGVAYLLAGLFFLEHFFESWEPD